MRPSASFTITGTSTRLVVDLDGVVKVLARFHILGHAARRHRLYGGIGGGDSRSIPSNRAAVREPFDPAHAAVRIVRSASARIFASIRSWPRTRLVPGGGIGRVADGASGISSGFCCAANARQQEPSANRQSTQPSRMTALAQSHLNLHGHPGTLYLSFFPGPASPLLPLFHCFRCPTSPLWCI